MFIDFCLFFFILKRKIINIFKIIYKKKNSLTYTCNYHQFSNKHDKICYFVNDDNSYYISHNKEKCIFRWCAKVFSINCALELSNKIKIIISLRIKFYVIQLFTKIYAFLLINFMNFSKHQKKHFKQQRKNLAMAFSFPLSLWSRYSRNTLMSWMIAIIRDPKAKVPTWYLYKDFKINIYIQFYYNY